MDILGTIRRRIAPRVAKYYESKLTEASVQVDYYRESMNTVQLELENIGYQRLTNFAPEYQFTQRHVMNIVRLANQMAIKNPITCRSVNVQADYVFGQGVSFVAKHPWVQQVIDEFVDYRENRKSLTSHTAMLRQERRQQVSGSMFLVLNTNRTTGRVIVRNLPVLEVNDIITDPDDREKEWYVCRQVKDHGGVEHMVYHPAYGIDEYSGIPAPWNVKGVGIMSTPHPNGEILWDAPVLHVAYNRLHHEKFALPEVYPQLDWALAYKRTLEQWISIIASFARMAMKVTGLSGKKQAAAAKALMQTSTSIGNPLEGNPSPVSGSTTLLGRGVDMEPIKTAGATTPASDADPILNFAGCAVGLPNTFFGDAGKGNFATAKTLDRPTELKMLSRQKLWIEIFTDVLEYVILQSAVAPEGILTKLGAQYKEVRDPFSGMIVTQPLFPANQDEQYGPVGQPIDPSFEVHFPEILERNVADRVRSLVNAVTLFGKPLMDIIPDKRLVAKLLLDALNVPNSETYIPDFVAMWTENVGVMGNEDGKPAKPYIIPPPPPTPDKGAGAEDPSQGGDMGNNG
jgi:hypothetical protein